MTGTSLRHCLVLAGVRLTTPELVAVDKSFRSVRRPETIAWQDFCKAAVDAARGNVSMYDGGYLIGYHVIGVSPALA